MERWRSRGSEESRRSWSHVVDLPTPGVPVMTMLGWVRIVQRDRRVWISRLRSKKKSFFRKKGSVVISGLQLCMRIRVPFKNSS